MQQEAKNTIRFSLPYTSSRLLNAANWFISMAIIARLGKEAVAVGVLMYSTVVTLQVIVWSMLFSVSVVVGKTHGEGKPENIGRIVQAGFLLAFLIGLPASFLLWHVGSMLTFLHQPAQLVVMATPYFHIMAFSVLPSLCYVCLYKFAIGVLRPRLVLYAMLCAVPLNLLLTFSLVFGKFGLPNLGIVGMAYANLGMYSVLFLFLLFYFLCAKEFRIFNLFVFGMDKLFLHLKKLFIIGWPISIEWGAMMMAYTFGTYMIGWVGTSALAAHQVATQCVNLFIMVPYSVAHITAVLVAQALGSGRRKFIEKIGYAGVFICLLVVGSASLLYWFTPHIFTHIYLHGDNMGNAAIIALAVSLLAVVGVTQLSDTVGAVLTGALRGFQDTLTPMLISITSNWLISIPLGYFCAFTLHLGAIGVYVGCLSGSLCGAFLLTWRWRRTCI